MAVKPTQTSLSAASSPLPHSIHQHHSPPHSSRRRTDRRCRWIGNARDRIYLRHPITHLVNALLTFVKSIGKQEKKKNIYCAERDVRVNLATPRRVRIHNVLNTENPLGYIFFFFFQ